MMKSGDKLKEIFSSKTPFQSLRLRLVLEDILLCIGESWSGAADWGRRAPFAEFSQINQALKMIFDSHSFVSTEAAAKACGMNRHKFSSLFRSWMKMRFSDFSLRHRLYQAAAQLRSTQDPLKLIAARYGFADESHFYRTFTRHYGVSPHDYRGRKL